MSTVFGLLVCRHAITCIPCLLRPGEGVRSPGSGVTDGRELPCRFWELKLGPLEQLSLLLDLLSIGNVFMQSKPKFQKNEGQALLTLKLVALLFFNPF